MRKNCCSARSANNCGWVKSLRENFVEYAGKARRETRKAILANAVGERVMLRCVSIDPESAKPRRFDEDFYWALTEQWHTGPRVREMPQRLREISLPPFAHGIRLEIPAFR